MTEPTFDPATDADAPAEETTTEETTAPAEETTEVAPEEPLSDPTEVPTEPEAPEVHDHAVEAAGDYGNEPELNAEPVSGVPSSAAVSDQPVQTDNRERPEDGEQDVSQDSTEVPSTDESPDVVA